MEKMQILTEPRQKFSVSRLTWGSRGSHSSACKITAASSLAFLLEVAVDGIAAVIFDSVRVVTNTIFMDWGTVSSSSTGIVQCFLKD